MVGHEPVIREPGPVHGVLALFDRLLGNTPSIVEVHYSFGASRHIGHDEAHSKEQLSLVPLHLGYHPLGRFQLLAWCQKSSCQTIGFLGGLPTGLLNRGAISYWSTSLLRSLKA